MNLRRCVFLVGLLTLLLLQPAQALQLEEATIADIQSAYLRGELTARQVVQGYLDRIAAYDKQGPYLNSIINLNPQALAEADQLDAKLKATGRLVGPLHGVAVLVKDNIDVVGMPMTAGFQGWKNYRPASEPLPIANIKAAGGIILGKTSLSEFARGGADNINSVLPGFARNPYNTAYATGGSSGGTGAAIAASFATVGIGTDTGGSIRNPSAHNALVGIRPTHGLVTRTGIVPLYSTRDTAGPMARTVTDAALLLSVMAGVDAADANTLPAQKMKLDAIRKPLAKDALKGARLGVFRQFFTPATTDARILAQFEKTLAELKAAGAELIDPFIVPEFDTLPRPGPTAAQFKDDMTRWIASHPGVPYPSVKEIADSKLVHPLHQAATESAAAAGPVATDAETLRSLDNDKLFRSAFEKAMSDAKIDAFVMPVWLQLAVVNGDRNTQKVANPVPGGSTASASTTFAASILRWPAIAVPAGYVGPGLPIGLPIGLQIVGRAWDDARLIKYAYAYEQATLYRRPPPTVPPLGPQ